MTASVHSLDCSFSQTPAVMRNGMTTEPNTHSARKSKGALVRAFQDCGYTTIGRSVGHDKSWVCRWLSGDSVANLPEVLHMLDTSGLRIVHEDDLEAGGDAELIARMERVLDQLNGIDSAVKALGEDGELHDALMAMARRALREMTEKAKAKK